MEQFPVSNSPEKESNPEMQEALNMLEDYLKQGYLLHGSKSKLEIVEPRKARDDNTQRTIGNLNGIYAADEVRVPILRALFAEKEPRGDWSAGYSGDEKNMVVFGDNYTFTSGYVHVLPKDTFTPRYDEEGNVELVSDVAVKSVDVIYVDPSILKLVRGITIDNRSI